MQRGGPDERPSPDSNVLVQLEDAVTRFEAAWAQGLRPEIEEHLPADASLRDDVLEELVHADLEFRLKAGDAVRIEEYLDRFPELLKRSGVVLDLAVREFTLLGRGGRPVSVEEYLRRFPDLGEELLTLLPDPGAHRFIVRLNCPHCRNPIELAADREEELVCPACGSTFRLDATRTQTWSSQRLPQLGRFKLLKVVGRGSFGTVYRARDTQLDRLVAIKVPRSGRLASKEDEDRFEREARSVARLQHPGIVPVYEVGRSEAFPFIVSELVEGVTLADFLTSRRLSFREAADTLRQAAVALDHAHCQGVIHRDLKPSNLLLQSSGQPDSGPSSAESESNASSSTRLSRAMAASPTPWRVRIMDFGLARRDEGELTVTMEGQVLGTPAYMSPEQARGDNKHVDRASDVYSLGVILYELLTGELPFRGNQRMLMHQVLYDDPRPPRQLNDSIPRDLETIALRAMSKEASRRYGSAAELADDLGRWLAGEPILSRPISRLERGWRWCRRNPAPSLTAATIVAAIIAVMITLSVAVVRVQASAESERMARQDAQRQSKENERIAAEERRQRQRAVRLQQEAERQRQAAQESQNRALAATAFLVSVFESADPLGLRSIGFRQLEDRDKPLTAREILDRGRQRVEQELAHQPLVQATLLDALGTAYVGLGELDVAAMLLQRGLDVRTKLLPREHPDVLASLTSRAMLKLLRSEMVEAESLLREVLTAQQKSGDVPPLALARTQFYLGLVFVETFRAAEAEQMFRAALATRERELGPQDQDTLMARVMLVATLFGENKEREIGLEEGLKLARAAHPNAPVALGGLFMKHYHLNKLRNEKNYEAAIVASRALREEAEQVLGSGHAVVIALEFDFAGILRAQGNLREAEAVGRRALERVPRVIASNPRLAEPHFWIGQVAAQRGQNTDAEKNLRTAMRVAGLIRVKEHLWGVRASLELARWKQQWGELQQAEQLCRDTLAQMQDQGDRSKITEAQDTLMGILVDQGKVREAIHLAKPLYETAWSNRDADSYQAVQRARVYALCLREQGDSSAARRMEAEALAHVQRRLPEDSLGIGETQQWALFLQEQGDLAAAEKLWRRSLESTRQGVRPNLPEFANALFPVAQFLRDYGFAEEALPLCEQGLAIRREVWGTAHQDILNAQIALTLTHRQLGHAAQALHWAREAHQNAVSMYGASGIQTYEASRVLAGVLADEGHFAEAEELLRDALKLHSEKLARATPGLAQCHLDLADLLLRKADFDEASNILHAAQANLSPEAPVTSWRLAEIRSRLALCDSMRGRSAQAEPALLESLAILENAWGAHHPRVREAVLRVARHYEAVGDNEAAQRFRAKLSLMERRGV